MGYGPGGEKYGDWRESEDMEKKNEVDEGKNVSVSAEGTNFEYIPGKRYMIEIQDIESGRCYYTKRIAYLPGTVLKTSEYNTMAGLRARIFDTKDGEIL